jgi:hypothetical protein
MSFCSQDSVARTWSGCDQAPRDHLVPGAPRVELDAGPPPGLVVARHSLRVQRIGDVLARQVATPHDARAHASSATHHEARCQGISAQGQVYLAPGRPTNPDVTLAGPQDAVVGLLLGRISRGDAESKGVTAAGDIRRLSGLRPRGERLTG